MPYVDGYVLVVPAKKLAAYKKMAKEAGPVWMKYGALEYVESVGEDFAVSKKMGGLTYHSIMGAKKGDKVIFAYVLYKSRKHRDAVNKKVEAYMNEKYADQKMDDMPFDMKRFAVAGFETFVSL